MEKVEYEGREYLVRYLGDAVYALSDGCGIWLHTGSHNYPDQRIFLWPQVLGALVRFMAEFDRRSLTDITPRNAETGS